MQIRAYIFRGTHISRSPNGLSDRAFGIPVNDAEINPSINLPESVLYTTHIPVELLRVIRHYSVLDQFPEHRTRGIYRIVGAEAVVKCAGNGAHAIEANSTSLANAVELHRRIRVGNIAPIISYEGEQVESTVLGVKKAAHQLIEAIALAFGQWRLRLTK